MKICVFGASSSSLARVYYDEAYALGALLARRGHTMVFGGGTSGLMGAAARGAESEGGGYALNSGLTHSGVAAEAGVMVSLGRICLSASAITIAGKAWQGSVGIGIRLYKSHK